MANENLNGLIRYFIPKGSKLKDIREQEVKKRENLINKCQGNDQMVTAQKTFLKLQLEESNNYQSIKFQFKLPLTIPGSRDISF